MPTRLLPTRLLPRLLPTQVRPGTDRRGFTLLELIVVVVILGILAAIAVPSFRALQARSADAAVTAELDALGRAVAALAAFDQDGVSVAHLDEILAQGPQATEDPDPAAGWSRVVDPGENTPPGPRQLYAATAGGNLGAIGAVEHRGDTHAVYLTVTPSSSAAEVVTLADLDDGPDGPLGHTAADALCFYGLITGCTSQASTDTSGSSGELDDDPDPVATVPSAPTDLAAAEGDRQLTATWSAPADDGGAEVSAYTATVDPAHADAVHIDPSVDPLAAVFSGLTNGEDYQVTVTATNTVGISEAAAVTATPARTGTEAALTAPSGLDATEGDSQVALSWDVHADDEVDGYQLWTDDAATPEVIVGRTTVTHTVTGLDNGTASTFELAAYDTSGNLSPVAAITATPHTTPSAPVGLEITAGPEQLTVSWDAPVDDGGAEVSAYTVSLDPADAGPAVHTDLDSLSTVLTGLDADILYTATVVATNAAGDSAPATGTGTPQPPVPATPTGLSADTSTTSATVTWNAVPGADAYGTRRATGTGSFGSPESHTSTTREDTDLSADTTYRWQVRACNVSGCSNWSVETSATTDPPAELIVNGGFEAGTVSPANTNTGGGSNIWEAQAHSNTVEGDYRLRYNITDQTSTAIIALNGSSSSTAGHAAASEGQKHTASFYIGKGSGTVNRVSASIDYRSDTTSLVGRTYLDPFELTTSSGPWTHISFTSDAAPAGTNHVVLRIMVHADGNTTNLVWDEVSLVVAD